MKGDFLGFSFDGIHCSKLGITHVSSSDRYDEDLFSEVKDKTIEIPNNHGEYYYGSTYGTRTFEIEIAYDLITETQFRNIRRLFGTTKICELIFDERPYKVYYAKIESPIQMSYVCFDEEEYTWDTTGHRSKEKDSETGQYQPGDYIPGSIDHKVRTGNKRRIYKGEGTISLICYQPFAHQQFKILDLYRISGENAGNLITKYSNVDEWAESSGLLTQKEWNNFHIDTCINANEPYTCTIPVYNPGDLDVGFNLYIPFSSNTYTINDTYTISSGETYQYSLLYTPIGEVIVTNKGGDDIDYIRNNNYIIIENNTEEEIEVTISYNYNKSEILPKSGKSDIIINGDNDILILKPIERKGQDTGIIINTHTHLIEGVILSQIANENDYRRPAWQTTGNLYNEYIKMGDFPQIKRNDWRLDDSSNRPQAIYISCAEDNKNISIYYDYLYF